MPQPAFIPPSQQYRGAHGAPPHVSCKQALCEGGDAIANDDTDTVRCPSQPPHSGVGLGSAYSMAFGGPQPPYNNWSQHQQHLSGQPQGPSPSGEQTSQRPRTSSSPQRPAPLTYNDTFHQQHMPGASYAAASRGNLPPGAMAPGPLSPPQGNGFHPYRRQQPRQSGGDGSPSLSSTPGPTASSTSSAANAAPSPLLTPPEQARTRSSSTNSNESAGRREAAPSVAGAPPVSFSAAAASSLSSQPPPRGHNGQQQSVSATPDTTTPKRPEPPAHTESARSTASSGAGAGSDRSLPHSRSESVSSQNSVYSSATSDRTSTAAGRAAPPAGAKKPSPLSRQPAAQQDDDDDDTGADYGGSDGEQEVNNGRATPTPVTEKKKGLSGKLRKALSLSTMNEIQQQQQTAQEAAAKQRPMGAPAGRTLSGNQSAASRTHVSGQDSVSGSVRGVTPPQRAYDNGSSADFSSAVGSSAASISSKRSGRPPLSGSAGDGSGKRSIFNRKFNSSTDNISISSTVSSASVMLRKVGNLGKIARRHSLMGLTNMFNKDKEGRDGMHDDDFGALPPSSTGAADDSALGGKSKKGKKGKGTPAAASVSHATVEQDINSDGSMTPAAHYVRQHQLQMQQQAEQEARAARENQEAAEAARLASLRAKGGKTTDDVVESRQKMIEKEKERLKSKRGWRNKLRVGGGSSVDQGAPSSNGLETVPYTQDGESGDGARGAYPGDIGSVAGRGGAPLQPLQQQQQHQQQYGGADGPSYDGQGYPEDDELLPPQMPAAGARAYGSGGEESGDEFETDSLRHWGEGIERSRASAALVEAPKSILKKSASSSQLDKMTGGHRSGSANNSISGGIGATGTPQAFERPFAGRIRANSYDAPQAGPQAGAPMLSAMSTTQDGADKMDGVTRSPSPNSHGQHQQQGDQQGSQQQPRPPIPSPQSALGHHPNSSMPTLSLMTNPTTGTVPRPSVQRKRIVFTEEHIYHSTWPAHVYDRRGELATCNRLTAELAQQIKEELNSYKMEEMVVAPSSRIYTHFFV